MAEYFDVFCCCSLMFYALWPELKPVCSVLQFYFPKRTITECPAISLKHTQIAVKYRCPSNNRRSDSDAIMLQTFDCLTVVVSRVKSCNCTKLYRTPGVTFSVLLE